jgi:hypothetical protein
MHAIAEGVDGLYSFLNILVREYSSQYKTVAHLNLKSVHIRPFRIFTFKAQVVTDDSTISIMVS